MNTNFGEQAGMTDGGRANDLRSSGSAQEALVLWRTLLRRTLCPYIILAALGMIGAPAVAQAQDAAPAVVVGARMCLTTTQPLLSGARGTSVSNAPSSSRNGLATAFWSTANPTGQNGDGNIELFLTDNSALAARLDAGDGITPTVAITQVTKTIGNIFGGINIMPSLAGPASGSYHWIVFVSDRNLDGNRNADGNLELFLAYTAPGQKTRFTQWTDTVRSSNILPSASELASDGTLRITFLSDASSSEKLPSPTGGQDNGNSERNFEVWLITVKLDPANPYTPLTAANFKRLTDFAGSSIVNDAPSISPDGRRVVYVSSRDGNSEIYSVGADGRGLITITQSITGVVNSLPVISDPAANGSGRRVAYVSNTDSITSGGDLNSVFVAAMPAISGTERVRPAVNVSWQIGAQAPAADSTQPALSKDGSRLTFISDGCSRDCTYTKGVYHLYAADAGTAASTIVPRTFVPHLAGDAVQNVSTPDLSSDGRTVSVVATQAASAADSTTGAQGGSHVDFVQCPLVDFVMAQDFRILRTPGTIGTDPNMPNPGDRVVYTVTITNGLPLAAPSHFYGSVRVDQRFSSLLALESAGLLPADPGVIATAPVTASQAATFTISQMPGSASVTVLFTATVRAIGTGGALLSTSSMTATNPAQQTGRLNLAADVTLPLTVSVVNFSTYITASAPVVREGQEVTFTITVSNAPGSDPITNLVVTDTVGPNRAFEFVRWSSSSAAATYDAKTGRFSLPRLNSNRQQRLVLVVRPVAGQGGQPPLIGAVRAISFDQKASPPTDIPLIEAPIRVLGTDLAILSKTVLPERPGQRELITYTIVISNAGPLERDADIFEPNRALFAVGNISVTDVLPGGLSFVAASPGGRRAGTVNGADRVIWDLPNINLSVDATTTVTVSARISTSLAFGAPITNVVSSITGRFSDTLAIMRDPQPLNNGANITPALFIVNTPPVLTRITRFSGIYEEADVALSYTDVKARSNITDVDVPTDTLQFRLDTIITGSLSVTTSQGLTVPAVPGQTLLGPNGGEWFYTAPRDRSGAFNAFTVRAWDGHYTSTVPVTVSFSAIGINDPPVIFLPPSLKVDYSTPYTFSKAYGNAIVVFDSDADDNPPPDNSLLITVSVARADDMIGVANALSATVESQAANSFALRGSQAELNAALGAGVVYTPAANFSGYTSMQVEANDLGHTGVTTAGLPIVNITTITREISVRPGVKALKMPDDGKYSLAAKKILDFQLDFSEPVDVSGVPSFQIAMDTGMRTTKYIAGSGYASLTFRYTIDAGDTAAAGITVVSPIANITAIKSVANREIASPNLSPDLGLAAPGISIDTTPPEILAIVAGQMPTITNADLVTYIVTFSEDVQDVDDQDFSIEVTRGNIQDALVESIAGEGSRYTVTVNTGIGNGMLRMRVPSSASIRDTHLNLLTGLPFNGEYYQIDKTSLLATLAYQPAKTVYKRGDVITITAETTADMIEGKPLLIAMSKPLTLTPTAMTAIDARHASYTFTPSNDVTATVEVFLSNAEDAFGNVVKSTPTVGRYFRVDTQLPALIGITPTVTATNAVTVPFLVTFSEPVTGVLLSDYSLITTGSIAGAAMEGIGGEGSTRSITVATGTGNGTIYLRMRRNTAIEDTAGNLLVTANLPYSGSVLVDKIRPTATITYAPVREIYNGVDAMTITATSNSDLAADPPLKIRLDGAASLTATMASATARLYYYTFTPAPGLSGIVSVSLVDGQDIAGNLLVPPTQNTTFTVDSIAPTVLDLVATSLPTETTAPKVTYQITFSEPVVGVTKNNFTITADSTISGTKIESVSGSGARRTITVNTGDGSGELHLDLVDATGITDRVGNRLSATLPMTGPSYIVDKTSLRATLTYNTPPGGVYKAGDNVTITARFRWDLSAEKPLQLSLSGAIVQGPSDMVRVTPKVYTYTLAPATDLSGTVTVMLGNAVDLSGMPVVTTPDNNTFLVDTRAPTVVSIAAADIPTTTRASSVAYVVTFSEQVTGVTKANFDVWTDGSISGAQVGTVSGSGITRTVTANTGDSDGLLGLTLANGTGITDLPGNNLGGTLPFQGASYLIDKTRPRAALTYLPASTFKTGNIVITATSDSDLSAAAPLKLTLSGVASQPATPMVRVSARIYTYTYVPPVERMGSITVELSDAVDLAGNLIEATPSSGGAFKIDTIPPEVKSIATTAPTLTNASQVDFQVDFDDIVVNVTADDFSLSTTGTLAGATVAAVTGSANTRTVRVNTGSGDGLLRLDLKAGTDIRDVPGNALAGTLPFLGESYELDRQAPTAALSYTPAPVGGYHKAGDIFITARSDSALDATTPLRLTLSGLASLTADMTRIDASTYVYTFTPNINLSGTITAALGNAVDLAGNLITPTPTPTSGGSFRIDTVYPTVQAIAAAQTPTLTNKLAVTYLVTFSEPVTNVTTGNFAVTTGGSLAGAAVSSVSGTGATRTVTVTTGTGSGLLRLDLNSSNGILDIPGNTLTGTLPFLGGTYQVDKQQPSVSSFVWPPAGTYLIGQQLVFTATWNEPVSVAGTPSISVTAGTSTVNAAYASGSGTSTTVFSYTVQSGDSSNGSDIAVDGSIFAGSGASIKDAAGNDANLSITGISNSIKVDGVIPTMSSLEVPPAGTYIVGQQLAFTATWSEPVNVAGTPSISVTIGASTAGAAYASGSGTGTTVFRYTVQSGDTSSGAAITLASSVRLPSGATIQDLPGNNASLNLAAASTAGILVDGIVPTLQAIATRAPTLTNAAAVPFTVTFSENVTGVITETFAVSSTLFADAAVDSVASASGAAVDSTWIVTVSTGTASGPGSLGLMLGSRYTEATDVPGNPLASSLPANAQSYTIDKVAPLVQAIAAAQAPTVTNGLTVTFLVTFSKPVLGVTTGNFTVTTDGSLAGAAVSSVSGTGATRTVTATTGTGSGLLRLDLDNAAGIQDIPGNTLGGTLPLLGAAYQVDKQQPSVASFVWPPAGTYLIGQQLVFTATWYEPVNVAGTPSISVTIGTSTVNAAYVSGSGTSTTVFSYTVQSGDSSNGSDIAVDGSIFAGSGASIKDAAGNDANLSITGIPNSVKVDGIIPTMSSLEVPPAGTYIVGQQLAFTATWSEPVNVAGTPSISVTIGASTAGAAYASGSGTSTTVFRYTVQSGDTSSGAAITLASSVRLPSGATIQDLPGNNASLNLAAASTAGILVDGIVPTLQAIATRAPTLTNAAAVPFTVTFSENVTGVITEAFAVSSTLFADAAVDSVASINGTTVDSTWIVTVSTGTASGPGSLGLMLGSRYTEATDVPGNPLANSLPANAQSYMIDKVAPLVQAIAAAQMPTVTNGLTVTFLVTFSKPVLGVTTGNFAVTTDGSLAGAAVSSISGTGATRTVTATTGTGSGLLRLDLDNAAGIQDIPGNALGGSLPFLGETYQVDKQQPTVVAIVRTSEVSITSALTVTYLVTFSEAVNNVTTANFGISTTGTIAGAAINGIGGTGATRTVTVTTGSNDGTLQLNLVSSGAIRDLATNAISVTLPFLGEIYQVEKTNPTAAISYAPVPATGIYKLGDSITITATTSKNIKNGTALKIALSGAATLAPTDMVRVTDALFTYVYTPGAGQSGTVTVTLSNAESTPNLPIISTPTSGGTFQVDTIQPNVLAINPASGLTVTNNLTVTYVVTFSENITGVTTSNFGISTTGTIADAAVSSVSGTGAAHTVTVTTGTGTGTLRLNLVTAGTITDLPGNPLTGSLPFLGGFYEIDKTAPTVVAFTPASPVTTTNSVTVTYVVTFSENVTGVMTSSFGISTTGTIADAVVRYVGGTGATRTITVTSGGVTGTLQLNLVANAGITDLPGNQLTTSLPLPGGEYEIDREAPTLLSFEPAGALTTTDSLTVTYALTFSEPVTGVAVDDFQVITGGDITNATVAEITGIGATRLVTVSANGSDGTVSLALASYSTIADALGNGLTGTLPVYGPTYTVSSGVFSMAAVGVLPVQAPPADQPAEQLEQPAVPDNAANSTLYLPHVMTAPPATATAEPPAESTAPNQDAEDPTGETAPPVDQSGDGPLTLYLPKVWR